MAATVLNSPQAVAMSVYVVRAFVRLRNELLAHTTLQKRLAHFEEALFAHDGGQSESAKWVPRLPITSPECLIVSRRLKLSRVFGHPPSSSRAIG
jgi:hypothetical protein